MIRTLKVIGVFALALALMGGCGDGGFLISTQDEIEIGQKVDRQLVQEHGLSRDSRATARVQRIGAAMAQQARRANIPYQFRLLASDQVNAFAAPGGFVYLTEGTVNFIGADDDALACVTAHEIGHIDQRHSVENLERRLGAQMLVQILVGGEKGQDIASTAAGLVMLQYSRDDELEADRIGVTYAARGGYDPWGMVRFFEKLREKEGKGPSHLETYFRTHPRTQDRINRITAYIRKHEGSGQ
jgi:predicted Zn-dependent protease